MHVSHQPDHDSSPGFTLIEVVVMIAILSIVTTVSVVALPKARNNQRLVTDTEKIQANIRTAERYAINEVRSDACIEYVGNDAELRRRCSNVGIALQEKQLITFADTTGDREYTENADFVIEEDSLSSGVESDGWQTIVFEATPPTIYTYVDGTVISPQLPATITLQAGEQTRTLEVHPYGRIEVIS